MLANCLKNQRIFFRGMTQGCWLAERDRRCLSIYLSCDIKLLSSLIALYDFILGSAKPLLFDSSTYASNR